MSEGGRTLRLALLQLPAFELAQHEAAWEEILRRIEEAATGAPNGATDLIVLPEASYPAYYLHSREAYDAAGVYDDAEVEEIIGEYAARHGCAIAVGLVQRPREGEPDDGRLRNVAVLFGRDGRVAARQPKRFLWHFDRRWFAPGEAGAPIALEAAGAGEVGLFICSDGRLPEITRELALGGAELLVDCTAWVSSGRDPAALSNPQVDYMLAARAIENGAWIAAADKVGVEADSIVYAGRSGVVDPRGRWRVQAPSDRPGVIHTAIDLDEASGPPVAPRLDLYGASDPAAEPDSGGAEEIVRVAAAAVEVTPSAVELMERLRALVTTLATQGAELVVLPDLARSDPHALDEEEVLPLLRALSADAGVMLAVGLAERAGGDSYKRLLLLDRGEPLVFWRQSHLDAAEVAAGYRPGGEPPAIVETRLGRIGLLPAGDALAPEPAHALRLQGAELLVWCAQPLPGLAPEALRALARTRAAENRVWLAASAGSEEAGGAFIVDPSGAVAAESPAGWPIAVAADVHRGLVRWSRVAPDTDPIAERRSARYLAGEGGGLLSSRP
ncbi:MAG: carbon-nitrogen hydrolase family protein [Chloroflexi bacterium]|nr:carbon-nitrogen hydrolase family protein [Chloroflexota bacterium]